MVRVDWAKPALDDLEGIHNFIARDSKRYARNTIEQLTDAAGRLAKFPQLGQILPEFPDSEYRQIVVGGYRLIYREDSRAGRVIVMGIIHASRDFPTAFNHR